MQFEGCNVGIDASAGNNGLFNLIDSTATNTPTLVVLAESSSAWSSLVLENVIVDDSVEAVRATYFH